MKLFELLGTIAVDNEAAISALDETAQKADNTGKQTESAFSKIGTAALTIGKAVVGAGVALGTAWIAAIESTRVYRAEMAKLDTAFVTNGHSSETAKQTYSELNAVLGDSEQAVEASQHLAKLTDNEKDLKTWTDICTGVYATFGASLPIEGLTEAANETAKTGVLTGGLTDALNWAGISEEEFQKKLDACTNEQERQKLIMDTLNGTYSKASEQYQKTNKDVMEARKAQERLTDAFAEFGRVGEPILTAIKNKVADMVAAAVPKLEAFIQKIKDAKKWLQDNKTTVDVWKAAIVGVTVSIGTFILAMKWSAIMSAATKAITATRAAVLLFNAALRANPIGLVVSLLAGLVSAFVVLWKNNESFRNFWIGLWNKIKSACNTAIGAIKTKFGEFSGMVSNAKQRFEDLRKSIADKVGKARDAVKTAVDRIKGLFNFKWSLPQLKVPKVSINGGKAPFGIGGKGSLPSFKVNWNKTGAIFDRPTIFETNRGLQGVGDGGEPEAVTPISVLQKYVSAAVKSEVGSIAQTIVQQNKILISTLERLIPKEVTLDGGALIGELLPGIDAGLNSRMRHVSRGNTR